MAPASAHFLFEEKSRVAELQEKGMCANDLRLETGSLDLGSAAIQQCRKELLLWLHRSTHRGVIDKHPVLAQHAKPEASVDHERFTQAWHSCLEPRRSVG